MSEATENDLVAAIKESLQRNGTLGKFKGELRAAIMSILNKRGGDSAPPKIPEETRLVNELIREYLNWNGYIYTESVLVAESSQNNEPLSRDVLTTKLGVVDDSKTSKIPLMYYIVAAFQAKNNNEDCDSEGD